MSSFVQPGLSTGAAGTEGRLAAPPPSPADAPPGTTRWALGHRPELTGLRAPLSVTVLIAHNTPSWNRGEWTALSIWFGLSGFLITAILLEEQQTTGRLGLTRFYLRRALRLLPALVVMVVAVVIYGSVTHGFDFRQRFVDDPLSTLFFTMDYREALGFLPPQSFFAHCWSLAVEEQFYLLWAVLLIVMAKATRRSTRSVLVAALVGIALSTADRFLLWHGPTVQSYTAFDARADALLFGCILGVICVDGRLNDLSAGAHRALGALAAAGLVTWLFFTIVPFAGGDGTWIATVTEVAAFLMLSFVVAAPSSWTARLLARRPLVHIGTITYGLYIWHYPVYQVLGPSTVSSSPWVLFVVRVITTATIAELSWNLVERPCFKLRKSRRLTARIPDPQLPEAAIATT